jgi:hypothetical protein
MGSEKIALSHFCKFRKMNGSGMKHVILWTQLTLGAISSKNGSPFQEAISK